MRAPIHVYGYIGDAAPLAASALDAVAQADVVVGGRRHLAALNVPAERQVVLGRLDPAIERLCALGEGERGVVVASGDPGFFGIVRRLREAGLDLVAEPGPSACALSFGRAGVPWEDGQVVSAHGRDLRCAVNVIRAYELVAVMTDVGAGLREIAAALGPWPRRLVLVEHIGEDDERVRSFSLEEALALDPADIREPNVVVAIAEDDAPSPWSGPGMPWRLGDRGTHRRASELRADVTSALVMGAFGAGPGDLLAVVGDETDLVAAAAVERGAAVRRITAAGSLNGPAGMDLLDEPDLVCVAATGQRLSEIFDAIAGMWTHVRSLAVLTDEVGIRLAEACLARTTPDTEFRCRRLAVPEAVDVRTSPAAPPAPTLHLLIADRQDTQA